MHARQRFFAYLQPSWLVNLVGLSLGVILTATIIASTRYAASDLRLQVVDQRTVGGGPDFYHAATDLIARNQFLSVLPLLLVWAGVGLIIYFFAVTIARSIGQVSELHEELDYVHLSRQALLRQALVELGLRVLAVIGWFVLLKISLSVLFPYIVSLATIASQDSLPWSVFFAVGSVVMVYATVCLHAVFIRLMLLKLRLFN